MLRIVPRACALLAIVVLEITAARVLAQSESDAANSAEATPGNAPANAATNTATNASSTDNDAVVFLVPETLDAATRASLQDALSAQLASIDVQLVLLMTPATDAPLGLDERMLAGKTLAQEHAALGVLWLDPRPNDHWFLYAMDASGERIVVRPLLIHEGATAAAVETVAVIARSAAEAMAHGEPMSGEAIVAKPIEVKPTPPAPPPPSAAPDQLRLGVGYAGSMFAAHPAWQSGVGIDAAFLWGGGPYVGLTYTVFPRDQLTVRTSKASETTFDVTRHPIRAAGGYRLSRGRLALGLELGALLDVLTRETTGGDTTKAGASTRYVFAITPAVRGELLATPWLGFFLTLGSDFFLSNFKYVQGKTAPKTLLAPYPVRLQGLVGVEILQ